MAVNTGLLPLIPRRKMQFSPHLARHGVINIVPHFAFKGT
jgi:hypothetical protein